MNFFSSKACHHFEVKFLQNNYSLIVINRASKVQRCTQLLSYRYNFAFVCVISTGGPCSHANVGHNVASEVYESYCSVLIQSFWIDHP